MEEINNQEEYELIRERIKTRPINRKKLIRRTVITAAMAVIFGVLACITFLVLEPVFSNMLTPEEEPVASEVKIPIDEEEILIEYEKTCIRIPMLDEIRSLNLSNSVAIVLYEALRQQDFKGMQIKGNLHRLKWKE